MPNQGVKKMEWKKLNHTKNPHFSEKEDTIQIIYIPLEAEFPLKTVTGWETANSLISWANCRIWQWEHTNISIYNITKYQICEAEYIHRTKIRYTFLDVLP